MNIFNIKKYDVKNPTKILKRVKTIDSQQKTSKKPTNRNFRNGHLGRQSGRLRNTLTRIRKNSKKT